jgi:type 1 glutamine amidotransferase
MRTIIAVLLALCITCPAAAQAPKKVLLLGQGPDGHPPQTHEYKLGLNILQKLLAKTRELQTTIVMADEPWREGPELLAKADGAVLFLAEGAKWLHQDPKRLAAFRDLAKRGGGLVCLHWAMGTRDAKNIAGWVEFFGGCHGGPDRKYKVLKTDVKFATPSHPIARGLKDFSARDEFYYHLKFPPNAKNLEPIVQADIDGKAETVSWAWQRPDGGRSFGFSGLHFHENWQMPEYRRLVVQGVLWSMKAPIPEGGVNVNVGE